MKNPSKNKTIEAIEIGIVFVMFYAIILLVCLI